MKLTDLFSRAPRRSPDAAEIDARLRVADDRTDRSSMAELARLLQQVEDPQEERSEGPA